MALGKPKFSFRARQQHHFRQQLWAAVMGKPQGSWGDVEPSVGRTWAAYARWSKGRASSVVSLCLAVQGLFSSVFTCAIWGTRLLIGAKGFLAPFFQLMPLTGEADTLGAPILQLKPSVVWIQAPKVFILLIITAFNKIEVSGSFPLCPVSFVIKRFPGTHHPCVPTLVGPALGTGIWSPCLIN